MKHRLRGIIKTREVFLDGRLLRPEWSQEIHNHSPDGFSWGYPGSGPAQLALAVYLEIFQEPRDYQEFKRNVISVLPENENFDIEFEL